VTAGLLAGATAGLFAATVGLSSATAGVLSATAGFASATAGVLAAAAGLAPFLLAAGVAAAAATGFGVLDAAEHVGKLLLAPTLQVVVAVEVMVLLHL